MSANAVTVWGRGGGSFSHVEGVVGRRRRVWMTVQPLAPSPAVVLCESDRGPGSGAATCFHPHMLTPPVERGPGRGLCESANDLRRHQSVCVCTRARVCTCVLWSREPSHALRAHLPMAPSHELMTSI